MLRANTNPPPSFRRPPLRSNLPRLLRAMALRRACARRAPAPPVAANGLIWDLRAGRIQLTPGWFRLTGFPPVRQPVDADYWLDCVHPADATVLLTRLRRMGKATGWQFGCRFTLADGRERTLGVRLSVLERDDEGRAWRVGLELLDLEAFAPLAGA